MRESDGVHFLWNGDHPLRVSPFTNEMWHHPHGELPTHEIEQLNAMLHSKGYSFTIKGHGRYRIVTRGVFTE